MKANFRPKHLCALERDEGVTQVLLAPSVAFALSGPKPCCVPQLPAEERTGQDRRKGTVILHERHHSPLHPPPHTLGPSALILSATAKTYYYFHIK